MLYKLETDRGQILIDRNVAVQVVEDQVGQFRGRAWLSSHRGVVASLMSLIGPRDGMEDIDIRIDEKGMSLRLYVIIRFGVSIRMITQELIFNIRKALEDSMEMKVNEITIVVTGTLSKHIAKRNIEVKG